MKNKIFKLLYTIFSFLADKTNGWKIFVNPKLFFGALIIGGITVVTTNSCTCYKPTPTCYDYSAIEDTIPQNDTMPDNDTLPLCYSPSPN